MLTVFGSWLGISIRVSLCTQQFINAITNLRMKFAQREVVMLRRKVDGLKARVRELEKR